LETLPFSRLDKVDIVKSTVMAKPRFPDNEIFQALRAGNSEAFSRLVMGHGRPVDFSNADFRGTDFRGVELTNVIIAGAYLKDADLRGVDLRHVDLEGCSLHKANVGGTYFPENVSPAEICMSLEYGTRLRVSSKC
jgi:uncharacterized protein YjbI with pentapeptide repeats